MRNASFACLVRAAGRRGFTCVSMLLVAATSAGAQGLERLTFQQAIERAIRSTPTVAQATAGIMRAEAVLQQVRSTSLPSLALGTAVNVTNPVKFAGASVGPAVQTQTTPTLGVPVLTPVAWAQRNQAGDQIVEAQHNEKDVHAQNAEAAGSS